jgi:hypothetical protein
MLLDAIDRAGMSAGEPQYDPGDSTGHPGLGRLATGSVRLAVNCSQGKRIEPFLSLERA